MARADFDMIMSEVAGMIRSMYVPVGEHGVAVGGSWCDTDDAAKRTRAGTIQVFSGKTAAIIGDDGDAGGGIAKPRVSMLTPAIGIQYAPRGGERTVMMPTEREPGGLFQYGSDDTYPGLLPGEMVLFHLNAAGDIDCYIQFTNDADTPGDGLGGIDIGFGSLAEIETAGGHKIIADDQAKTITLKTAGGLSLILNDNSGKILQAGSSGAAGDAMMNATDVQNALNAFKAAMVTANVPNAGAIVVPTVTGSSKNFTS